MSTMPKLMTRTPQIIDGLRGALDRGTAEGTFQPAVLAPVPEGHRMYRSLYAGFRLNLGKRKDSYDNDSGTKIKGTEFTAIFSEHHLRLPEFFHQIAMEDEGDRVEFIRRLEASPEYGKSFFNVAVLGEQARAQHEADLRQQLDANPALKARLAEEYVASGGFKLPTTKPVVEAVKESPLDSVEAQLPDDAYEAAGVPAPPGSKQYRKEMAPAKLTPQKGSRKTFKQK